MILFIHGFGSCGWGEKSLYLRRHFGLEQVLAPDLPFHPTAAIEHLQRLLDRYPVSSLIGSSLGGFYATWLNAARPLPTVLINPVVRPAELLTAYLGPQQRWCDGAEFHVGTEYLQVLLGLERKRLAADEHYLVLLQQGDETLDYREAADFYRAHDIVIFPGGSHRFDQFEQQLSRISDWLSQHSEDHAQEAKTTA